MRVGLIGLGEAGNLGDDLILISTVQAIARAKPGCIVRYLSFGQGLAWEDVKERLSIDVILEPVHTPRDLPFSSVAEKMFTQCDAIVFGGGGLLQDTHHPVRPYHWLRYLPDKRAALPTLAVGLGVGPLSRSWDSRFKRTGIPFSSCYVRDDESLALLDERFGWPAQRSTDFVTPRLVRRMSQSNGVQRGTANSSLGVAIRAWPQLDKRLLANHINRVAEWFGYRTVTLFVLESYRGDGLDVAFSQGVRGLLDIASDISTYDPQRICEFVTSMAKCETAVSMKLHSSVIWAAHDTVIFPIFYAPKTAALFGRPYNGLQVYSEPMEVRREESIFDAQDALENWLNQVSAGNVEVPEGYLRPADRLTMQSIGSITTVLRKVRHHLRIPAHA